MAEMTLHCTFCGSSFGDQRGWPRTCPSCHRTTYRNPLPVGVLLLPVRREGRTGLLVIRRGIEPARGQLALPGGYVEDGESWHAAACREVREEADVHVDPATVTTFEARSNPAGDRILLFALAPAVDEADLPPFSPTSETAERTVIFAPETLAFSLHTEAVEQFFRQRQS